MSYAFEGSYCKNVQLPYGVTSISDYAFYKHTYLQSISIPDSVKHIGTYAFYQCSNLQEISLPDGKVFRMVAEGLSEDNKYVEG